MPEGPEVRVIADFLSLTLNNTFIYKIGTVVSKSIRSHTTWDLPLKVESVNTKGKHIIISTKDSKNKAIYLHSHLGMTGEWYKMSKLDDQPHRLIEMIIVELIKDKYCFKTYLCFKDTRRFAHFDVWDQDQLTLKMKTIGPDLLQTGLYNKKLITSLYQTMAFDLSHFTNLIQSLSSKKRSQNKAIGVLLMEQNRFSGIGNYLRAEILYQSKISPFRAINKLTKEEIKQLYHNMINFIVECYLGQGQSLYTFKVPEEIKTQKQVVLKIYGKERDPLGNQVIKEKLKDRTIHWVPEIQV